METLVRHLVRHGIEFRTLMPSSEEKPTRVLKTSSQLVSFTGIPAIPDIKVKRTVQDYYEYVSIRKKLMEAPEAKPAYRARGILWHLAMESVGNFKEVINHIIDGPSEVGPTEVEYFLIDTDKFYDTSLSSLVADTICRMHGDRGCKNFITIKRIIN